jgi:hypothetical protein
MKTRSNSRHPTIRRERILGIGNQIPIVLVFRKQRKENVKISLKLVGEGRAAVLS